MGRKDFVEICRKGEFIMYKMDELIREIHTNEVLDIQGELTKEQQDRIADRIFMQIDQQKKRSFPKSKRHVVLLVAVLILVFGITAFAAKQNEWDIVLSNFMGLNDPSALQLDGGEVVIDKKITSSCTDYANNSAGERKNISITGITSIGDRNSAYLRINTDYDLPQDFDETTDYILPENSKVDITYRNVFGHNEIRSFGSVFTSFYENGKLGFLVSIENCEELNKCDVSIKIENLYWYHDLGMYEETQESEPEELLCEGVWETNWRYSYKANVRTCYLFRKVESEDGDYYLRKVEISPISIRLEAIRNPKDREREWKEELLDGICYTNGNEIRINRVSSAGMKNGIFRDEFVKIEELGEILIPEEISHLVVSGEKVDL